VTIIISVMNTKRSGFLTWLYCLVVRDKKYFCMKICLSVNDRLPMDGRCYFQVVPPLQIWLLRPFLVLANSILSQKCNNIIGGLSMDSIGGEGAMKQAIAYYRVSTQRQGESRLGLEAQQVAVMTYCKTNDYELLSEVTEVKSTRKYRVRLVEALALCKKLKATLVVAKLDRLGRDVEQIAGIVKSSVEIIVTDNPHANRFTIHILAAVAEEQRQKISDTTKEALAAAKRRGVVLGKNGKSLSLINKKAAAEFAAKLLPLLKRLINKGITSVRAISHELNKRHIPTFRGVGQWHPSTVHIMMNRLKNELATATSIIQSAVPI
jgi:DNA invertase Pin-like site-specific DNA recombinase